MLVKIATKCGMVIPYCMRRPQQGRHAQLYKKRIGKVLVKVEYGVGHVCDPRLDFLTCERIQVLFYTCLACGEMPSSNCTGSSIYKILKALVHASKFRFYVTITKSLVFLQISVSLN